MKNKYYTPEIEEFHVGFECEWQCKVRNETWNEQVCDGDLVSIAYDSIEHSDEDEPYEEQFRVKYLDKQDIEEVLKVRQLKGDDIELNFQILLSDSEDFYEVDYETDTLKLTVELFKETDKNKYSCYTLFSGKIKNKTEFKRLLKQLDLKC